MFVWEKAETKPSPVSQGKSMSVSHQRCFKPGISNLGALADSSVFSKWGFWLEGACPSGRECPIYGTNNIDMNNSFVFITWKGMWGVWGTRGFIKVKHILLKNGLFYCGFWSTVLDSLCRSAHIQRISLQTLLLFVSTQSVGRLLISCNIQLIGQMWDLITDLG